MQQSATGSFDELAESYDRFRIGYAPELYDALFEFGLAPGARIVDVGCGTGIVMSELGERGPGLTGVDRSEPMLARARERVPGARLVHASAEALPFSAAAFDAAVSAQAFHWFDQPAALHEIVRVVGPGGIVAIWWKGLMRGDTTRLLREGVSREVGVEVLPDLLATPFDAFECAGFEQARLRVIPWRVPMTVDAYMGYERSRARSRDAYGVHLERYLERLHARLLQGGDNVMLSYVHHLYLGRVPAGR